MVSILGKFGVSLKVVVKKSLAQKNKTPGREADRG